MSAVTRNRLIIVGIGTAVAAVGLFTGTTLSGDMSADISVKHTPFGAARLGVEGGLGRHGRRTPIGPVQPAVVVGGSPPYNGTTQEELDAFNEVRAATKELWKGVHEGISEVVPGENMATSQPPPLALVGRHLTRYEIDELHRTARRLRGEDVPSPVGT